MDGKIQGIRFLNVSQRLLISGLNINLNHAAMPTVAPATPGTVFMTVTGI